MIPFQPWPAIIVFAWLKITSTVRYQVRQHVNKNFTLDPTAVSGRICLEVTGGRLHASFEPLIHP